MKKYLIIARKDFYEWHVAMRDWRWTARLTAWWHAWNYPDKFVCVSEIESGHWVYVYNGHKFRLAPEQVNIENGGSL